MCADIFTCSGYHGGIFVHSGAGTCDAMMRSVKKSQTTVQSAILTSNKYPTFFFCQCMFQKFP